MNPEIYTDVSIIIGMMSDEMRNKISRNFIEFIENHKSTTYCSNINPKIPLKEQTMREETKILLGIIYRDYLCDQVEKKRLLEQDRKELEKLELEKREKYNPDKLFEKPEDEQQETKEEIALIDYKESIFKKIYNKIRRIFFK